MDTTKNIPPLTVDNSSPLLLYLFDLRRHFNISPIHRSTLYHFANHNYFFSVALNRINMVAIISVTVI